MDVQGKIKTIYPAETLTFQDGRTYTQQLIILDCGEYSRGGDFYENDLPFYFGEKHLSKLTAVTVGAQVSVSFGIKGRTYTYTDKKDQVTERTGHSARLNAYDIQMVSNAQPSQGVQTAQPAQHPQTAQPYAPQAPMQAPTAQIPQRPAAPVHQYPQTQAPQVQQADTDDLPF